MKDPTNYTARQSVSSQLEYNFAIWLIANLLLILLLYLIMSLKSKILAIIGMGCHCDSLNELL